jgi:lysozyme family protein
MVGVIQRVYDGWRQSMGLSRRPVHEIEDHEVRAIYRQNYWNLVRGDELPPGVDLAVFDFGVNSGCARAVKYLQRLVGVTPDGALGALTLAAVRRHDPEDLVQRLMAERQRFVRKIPHYWRFGKGWERRLDGVERACLAMLGHSPQAIAESIPALPDTDSNSAPQMATLVGLGRATTAAPETMAGSTTGNTAAAIGGGGVVQIGLEVGNAAAKVQATGAPVDIATLLIALAQSVSFWLAVVTIAGSVYVWIERRRKLVADAQ